MAQPPRFLLALFLAFGIAPPWAIVVAMVMENLAPRILGRGAQETLLVRSDGTAIIHTQVYGADRHAVSTYRTSDGRSIDIDPATSDEPWQEGTRLANPADTPGDSHLRNDWRWRLAPFLGIRGADWYFVRDNQSAGHAYFVGYNVTTRDCVGYLGRTGFSGVVPPLAGQFPIDNRTVGGVGGGQLISSFTNAHWNTVARTSQQVNLLAGTAYLLSADRLWRIDLRQRSVDELAEFPDALNLSLAPAPPDFDWTGGTRADERLLVRTVDEILLVDLSGQTLRRWTLPTDARLHNLDFYDLGDGAALVNVYLLRAVGDRMEHELLWLDAPDKVRRRERVEMLQGGIDADEVWTIAPALPMPSVLTAIFVASAGEVRGADYQSNIGKAFVLFWPALAIVYLLSAGLAWLAYRRQRRFRLPAAGGWAVFVFLFGVPGWLAHRWHRAWPVIEACDECQRPVPHDRETCVACGALFRPAPLSGAEVFA
jgi:hypothetical protein